LAPWPTVRWWSSPAVVWRCGKGFGRRRVRRVCNGGIGDLGAVGWEIWVDAVARVPARLGVHMLRTEGM
jgi:hypothetical protein